MKIIIVLFSGCIIAFNNLCAIELLSLQQEQFKDAGTDCAYFSAINAKTLLENKDMPLEGLVKVLNDNGAFEELYLPLKKEVGKPYLHSDEL